MSTSCWPRSAARLAPSWAAATIGQVASTTAAPRRAASARISAVTPCAGKTTMSPASTSASEEVMTAPRSVERARSFRRDSRPARARAPSARCRCISAAACRAALAACSAPLHHGLPAEQQRPAGRRPRPIPRRAARAAAADSASPGSSGGGDGGRAAVLLRAGDQVERRVELAGRVVAAGQLCEPDRHGPWLRKRSGNKRRRMAAQHAVHRIADLGGYHHLAAAHADAGHLNFPYR